MYISPRHQLKRCKTISKSQSEVEEFKSVFRIFFTLLCTYHTCWNWISCCTRNYLCDFDSKLYFCKIQYFSGDALENKNKYFYTIIMYTDASSYKYKDFTSPLYYTVSVTFEL